MDEEWVLRDVECMCKVILRGLGYDRTNMTAEAVWQVISAHWAIAGSSETTLAAAKTLTLSLMQ